MMAAENFMVESGLVLIEALFKRIVSFDASEAKHTTSAEFKPCRQHSTTTTSRTLRRCNDMQRYAIADSLLRAGWATSIRMNR